MYIIRRIHIIWHILIEAINTIIVIYDNRNHIIHYIYMYDLIQILNAINFGNPESWSHEVFIQHWSWISLALPVAATTRLSKSGIWAEITSSTTLNTWDFVSPLMCLEYHEYGTIWNCIKELHKIWTRVRSMCISLCYIYIYYSIRVGFSAFMVSVKHPVCLG